MRNTTPRALCSILLAASVAHAAPGSEAVQLTWNAPASCPSGDAVSGEVERMLGGATSHHASARADVTELAPADWSVHLVTHVDGAPGERSLRANSCEALAKATALILALTVDPTRAHPEPAPAPSTPPPSPPPPPAAAATEPVRFLAALEIAGDLGTLPKLAGGGSASVGVLFGPVRAELTGADWFAQDAHATPTEGTHIHLLEGGARGCFRGRFGDRFELDPCAGGALVLASSDGFGESQSFQRSSTWGALRGDLLSTWRFAGPFALRATLGLGVPIARPPFVLLGPQGETSLHRAAAITGRGTLGVEMRFP